MVLIIAIAKQKVMSSKAQKTQDMIWEHTTSIISQQCYIYLYVSELKPNQIHLFSDPHFVENQMAERSIALSIHLDSNQNEQSGPA